ncbi:isopeptide-forming domain-containing fimbrial protein [Vagococcus sp.]|uniref:isopeptide-forming domain-containing fimbrial protein n=1 Tax=Vagococcus sp. TaxID=1933889 RepID=UPI0010E8B02B|nr:isopeptide-forming domain-containing fimbrial protein [Listeria monocytogenes]EAD4370668.1 isopeptide-forming domain-containing fimbrial protein [Listeria monocytogenes]
MKHKKKASISLGCLIFIVILVTLTQFQAFSANGDTYGSILDKEPSVDNFELTGSEFPGKEGSWGISVIGESGNDMYQTVTINPDGGLSLLNDKYGNPRSTGLDAVNTLKAIRKINGEYTELDLDPYEYLEYEEHAEIAGRKIENMDTAFYNLKSNPLGFNEQGQKLNFNHTGDYLGFQILVDTNNPQFTGVYPEGFSGVAEVRLAGKSILTPKPIKIEYRNQKNNELLLPVHYEVGSTGNIGSLWEMTNPLESELVLLKNQYELTKVTLDGNIVPTVASGVIDEKEHTVIFWYTEIPSTSNTSEKSSESNVDSNKSSETRERQFNYESGSANENTHESKIKKEQTELIPSKEIESSPDEPKNSLYFPERNSEAGKEEEERKPKITKRINNNDEEILKGIDEEITWEIIVEFGNRTKQWKEANIVDDVPSILEIKNVEIINENKENVSGIGYLKIENNQVRFIVVPKKDGFQFLTDKTIMINIKTKIRANVTEKEIQKFLKKIE